MEKKWMYVAGFFGAGFLVSYAVSIISTVNKIKYEVLSYQIQDLDNAGVTLRFMFSVTNPTGWNLDVWNQHYYVYVAGNCVSEIFSKDKYRLLGDNKSVLPLDVRLTWNDIQQYFPPLATQSSQTNLDTIPVLIKGNLSARMGILNVPFVPFRTVIPLSYFLP